jgi:hypothetical protein
VKLLLTELGNTASGDPELWAETCRRLPPDHEITLLHRLPDPQCLSAHGLGGYRLESCFLPPLPASCACPESLDRALAGMDPAAHAHLHDLVAAHDLVMIAPGGKYLDGYHYQNALAAASAARVQGKPFIFLHQSIGPLRPEPRRELLTMLLREAALVLLRDVHSYRFVRELAGDSPAIRRTADPLLALPETRFDPPAYDLGFNFRLGSNGWVGADDLIHLLKRHRSLRFVVYTTTHPLPSGLVEQVQELGGICRPGILAPPDLLAVPGSCRVNVTDSFHGVIFSLLAGRPAVMCQADLDSWKLQGTFTSLTQVRSIHPGPNSPTRRFTLQRRIRNVLRDPAGFHSKQTRDIQELQQRVEDGWKAVEHTLSRLG